jgi:hypothetical protein
MAELKLTQVDRASPTWRSLSEYLNDRLSALRLQNDMPRMHEETAFLRGQIAEIKVLLRLGEEPVKRIV